MLLSLLLICAFVSSFHRSGTFIKRSLRLCDFIRRPRPSNKPRINKKASSVSPEIVSDDGDSNKITHKKGSAKKNFSVQTILGENIINCRDFSPEGAKTVTFVGSYESINQAPEFGFPEVAFIGRSNVGKSSLLNMLSGLNKNVAVVSKTPGRTRMINLFKCKDKDGDICVLVDLPGDKRSSN